MRRFTHDQSGATAIEYALIAGFIALAIVASIILIPPALIQTFATVSAALTPPPP